MDQAILEKVQKVVANQLGLKPEQVTPESTFNEDLGADSLEVVELIMEFESEFGVSIPDEDAERIRTVADACRYIEEKAGTTV
ncbi:MAG: acyl carrier protein [Armatimonadetes bacterium]|nr:acyl carrier protein [Armatimonadota bacterium]